EPLQGSLDDPRAFFGTADLGNGRIAIAGGVGDNDTDTGFAALDSVEVFDGTAFGFELEPNSLASAHAFTSAVPIPSGGALVVGGSSDLTAATDSDLLDANGNPTGGHSGFKRVFSAAAQFRDS